jgi:dihydrofolate reductase
MRRNELSGTGATVIIARIMTALALIAAVARNGVIGGGNALPWHLPADLKHFRALTTGHAVIMGRRTWESIGRALPGRQNIVVTRQPGYAADGAVVQSTLDDALRAATLPEPVFCIGGGELYALALPRAATLHLTEIDRDFDGDTRFPEFDRAAWREAAREEHRAPEGFNYAFVTYERR